MALDAHFQSGIVEGNIDTPEVPLDSVIDLLQALANKAKE